MSQSQLQYYPSEICLEHLEPNHYEALERAIRTVFSTTLATETYAQVIDGIPTCDVHRDYYGYRRKDFSNNLNSSQHALQAVESYRQSINISHLQVDTKVAQAYQDTAIGSREFSMRLIEILAIVCHRIAVRLSIEYEGGLRKPDPEEIHRQIRLPKLPPPLKPASAQPNPVELFHPSYTNWQHYPNGLADIVGYWAEYRLFGGVVLFDRGEAGSACNDVFIHPIGRYKIFQLTDAQIQHYVNSFLLASTNPESNTKPDSSRFYAEKYARRVDPYDAMDLNIYRNRYERKIPDVRPISCVGRGEDIPGYEDSLKDLVERSKKGSTA